MSFKNYLISINLLKKKKIMWKYKKSLVHAYLIQFSFYKQTKNKKQ